MQIEALGHNGIISALQETARRDWNLSLYFPARTSIRINVPLQFGFISLVAGCIERARKCLVERKAFCSIGSARRQGSRLESRRAGGENTDLDVLTPYRLKSSHTCHNLNSLPMIQTTSRHVVRVG